MRAVIFANGLLTEPELVFSHIQPGDWILAADGGALHCRSLGIRPAVIIGDFDSLSSEDVQFFISQKTELIRFPVDKDYTDLELALQHACSSGAETILVFGALGLRWDQSLANLLLPALPDFENVPIILMDGAQEMSIVGKCKNYSIVGRPGDTVSLIPISGDVSGVTTQGLKFPLKNETLFFGSSRGVSNVLLASEASIDVEQGLLVCVVLHQA